MGSGKNIVLRMEGISKRFLNTVALSNVTFEVERGSVHALVGENGAGKSTLMKILSGVYTADSGKIFINGKETVIKDANAAISLGISMVYQELNYVPEMTIGENLFLGREPKNRYGYIDKAKMYTEADRLFSEFNLHFDVRAQMKTLSIANMQMVEIVKALSKNARIIVMDEPTSSLTDRETELLFKFIKRLTADGIAIIYISHRMEELEQIADYVTVLRDGEVICTHPKVEMNQEQIVTQMVGRSISVYYPKTAHHIGKTVLRVDGLAKKGIFENVSFEVKAGEILGVSGLVGAGRTEAMCALFGMLPSDRGVIAIDGKPVKIRNVWSAVRHGIAYVSEERKKYGLVMCRSLLENVTLPHLTHYRPWSLRRKEERSDVSAIMSTFSVKAESPDAFASSLSGGNQQKVVLSKWLLKKPRVLILDEPTRGIDVGSKYEIYRHIDKLAHQGIAIIMISSELPEILGMSDRVMVMCEGRVTAFFSGEEATSNNIMKAAMER